VLRRITRLAPSSARIMLLAGGSRLLPRVAGALGRSGSVAPFAAPLRSRAAASWPPAARSGGLAAWRATLDSRPDTVLYGLIAANCGVWAAWQTQSPSQQRFLARHFMVHADAFSPARAHTLLTAAFSQRDAWHLGGNMLSLYFFGREVGRLFGGVRLAQLYIAGGVAASAAHVAWTRSEWRRAHPYTHAYWGEPRGPPALGASGAFTPDGSATPLPDADSLAHAGAVNAVVLFDTLLFPWRIVYVNFILPVPALLLGAAVLSRDAYGAWGSGGGGSGVAHAGHVGGAAVGAAAWAAFRLRIGRW
jgi:membrane associated rhomboid family serine protease